MLNKNICKKCIQKHSEKRLDKLKCVYDAPFTYNKSLDIYLCFIEDFEFRWFYYRNVCTIEVPIIKDHNIITGKKDNNIPNYCPYYLEHLLNE